MTAQYTEIKPITTIKGPKQHKGPSEPCAVCGSCGATFFGLWFDDICGRCLDWYYDKSQKVRA